MPPRKPPTNGSGDEGQEQFKALLREFFTNEVLPNLNRHQQEVIEAHIAKLREEVGPEALAEKTAQLLAPKFSQDMQAIVNALRERMADVEAKVMSAGARPATVEAPAAPAPSGGNGFSIDGLLAAGETLLNLYATKIWPMQQQNQMMKVMGEYGGLIPLAAHIRDTNPMMGQIMAHIMAPDQLINMMAMTIPGIAAQAMAQGMRAKSLAQALAANPSPGPGGGTWPGTPSSGSPGSLPGLGVLPNTTTPGSQPGTPEQSGVARMAQRPKPKPKLRPRAVLREPKPSATEPGSAPARSLREALG